MSRIESFPPIVSEMSKVLILGSMPGELSLRAGQYYAHPRNAFWPIMGELFGAGPALPYGARITRLEAAGIALWDTLQTCVRPGSLDTSITEEAANDFATFFSRYRSITQVFFNGRKAEAVFHRHAMPSLRNYGLTYARLPSTSPAHAGMSLAAKVKEWSIVRRSLG
jgi:TDG/mug DNA glycosylase family protein